MIDSWLGRELRRYKELVRKVSLEYMQTRQENEFIRLRLKLINRAFDNAERGGFEGESLEALRLMIKPNEALKSAVQRDVSKPEES